MLMIADEMAATSYPPGTRQIVSDTMMATPVPDMVTT